MRKEIKEIEERKSRASTVPLIRKVINERSAFKRREARVEIFKEDLMDK